MEIFRRIRADMRVPFAPPPGRRGMLARFAPEWCALAVWTAVTLSTLLPAAMDAHNGLGFSPLTYLTRAAAVGYALAGLLLFAVPVGMVSVTWAAERRRGTLDAVLLASPAPAAMVRGRYWHLVLPWARFIGYMLPVYVLVGGGAALKELLGPPFDESSVLNCLLGGTCPKVQLTFAELVLNDGAPWRWRCAGQAFMLARLVNDLSILLFATGLASWVSVRACSSAGALALGYGVAGGVLATVMSVDTWLLVTGWHLYEPCCLMPLLPPVLMVSRFFIGDHFVYLAGRTLERRLSDGGGG